LHLNDYEDFVALMKSHSYSQTGQRRDGLVLVQHHHQHSGAETFLEKINMQKMIH